MMDAVEYLKEKERMCDFYEQRLGGIYKCGHCGMGMQNNGYECTCHDFERHVSAEAVRIVEEWSKAHPIQTNADKFKEVFGLTIPPTDLCPEGRVHLKCEWLDLPYKAPKGEDE